MRLWEQRTAEGIILSLVTLNFAIHSEDLSKSKFGQHFQNTKYCSMFVSDSKFECYAQGLIRKFLSNSSKSIGFPGSRRLESCNKQPELRQLAALGEDILLGNCLLQHHVEMNSYMDPTEVLVEDRY